MRHGCELLSRVSTGGPEPRAQDHTVHLSLSLMRGRAVHEQLLELWPSHKH